MFELTSMVLEHVVLDFLAMVACYVDVIPC
jgi:hypothetical protein